MNHSSLTLTLSALASAALIACGGASEDPAQVDAEAEAVAAASTAAALTATAEVGGPVAERDRARTDVMDAVRDAYGRRMSCADIALAAGVLAVDFGAGCPVHGHTVAGAFSVTYTRTGTAATSFTLMLDDLDVDGVLTDGTVQLSAASGTLAADATLLVTEGAVATEHLFAGTMTPDQTGVLLDGSASRDDGAQTRDIALDAVYVVYGDCYPSAGRISLDASGQPTTLVTFDAQTPVTGEVSVKVGRLPAQTVTLPACPR